MMVMSSNSCNDQKRQNGKRYSTSCSSSSSSLPSSLLPSSPSSTVKQRRKLYHCRLLTDHHQLSIVWFIILMFGFGSILFQMKWIPSPIDNTTTTQSAVATNTTSSSISLRIPCHDCPQLQQQRKKLWKDYSENETKIIPATTAGIIIHDENLNGTKQKRGKKSFNDSKDEDESIGEKNNNNNAKRAVYGMSGTAVEQQQQHHHHHHAIPKILIFTHYRNLLDDIQQLTDQEEIVLSKNIQNSIDKHSTPNVTPQIRFLTDDGCIESLQRVYPALIPYFQNETRGMFKADICRGSALYETGGIYLDVDVGVRKDLWTDLLPKTEFVTCKVHRQSQHPNNFFQAILGAAPQSRIIYKYLQLFYDHYTGKEVIERGPLGVILLRHAWDRIYDKTTHVPSTELYQEVLYDKKIFPKLHPAPTWGTRRACHFVVVARVNNIKSNTEFEINDLKVHIPLYSRIGGSRMCPTSNKYIDNGNNTTNTKTMTTTMINKI